MRNTIRKIFLLLLTALTVVCFAVACKTGGENSSYTSSESGENSYTSGEESGDVSDSSSKDDENSSSTSSKDESHTHTPSEVKIENSTKPQIHSQDESLKMGYFDEVTRCALCGDVISSVRTYNYYHQFDYLELSDTVNNLDGLTEIGDGKYLLNAKTNEGKDVRLFFDGEIERLDGGWGIVTSETKIYSLDALPGINYTEFDLSAGEDAGSSAWYISGLYNFDLKDGVEGIEELFNAYMIFYLSGKQGYDMASFFFDYFVIQTYDVPMNISDLRIYYCDEQTKAVDVDIRYDLTQAYVAGDRFKDDESFFVNILFDNPEADTGDNELWLPTEDRRLVPFGDIIDANGNACDRANRIIEKGDKLEVKLGAETHYIDLCVDTFVGENLTESMDTQNIVSIGTQNVLVVPVTFTDQRDRLTDEAMNVIKRSLGNVVENGNVVTYAPTNGRLSLSEYINTSSYGKLTVQSYITDPYVIRGKGVDYYSRQVDFFEDLEGWLTRQKFDLSVFDQNGDGFYDVVILVNTLDISKDSSDTYYRVGMSGAFCGTRTYYKESAGTKESPVINRYVNMPFHSLYKDMKVTGDMNDTYTNVLIHEFGHSFGLLDYYNIDGCYIDVVGTFDMQSGNVGDWNSYTKYALGWIDPIVVDGQKDVYEFEISAYSKTGNAILIPALNHDYNGTPFDEYVMIELFAHDGLYAADSANYGLENSVGVKIYHVNSVYEKRVHEYEDGTTTVVGSAHHVNNKDTRYFEEGRFLVELIQKGNVNTFATPYERSMVSAEDLFYKNDVFTADEYDQFFYNGKMDNGMDFGYKITIVDVVADGENSTAKIRIEKQA